MNIGNLVLAALVAGEPLASERTAAVCSVTMPMNDLRLTADCPGNYGGNGLWVGVPEDGTIVFLPGGAGFVLPDGSLAWKFVWCKKVPGKLAISGKRLDGTAPPLKSEFNAALVRGGVVPSHQGTMRRGGDFKLSIVVVPDSGTGQLAGLTGTMAIIIKDGKHSYELDYTLPEAP